MRCVHCKHAEHELEMPLGFNILVSTPGLFFGHRHTITSCIGRQFWLPRFHVASCKARNIGSYIHNLSLSLYICIDIHNIMLGFKIAAWEQLRIPVAKATLRFLCARVPVADGLGQTLHGRF